MAAALLLAAACATAAAPGADDMPKLHDGLPGVLQQLDHDAAALQLQFVRSGLAAGKVSADASMSLERRCVAPLRAALDAATATADTWPSDQARPSSLWFYNPAVDLIVDAPEGATEIAVKLRADGSTGLGWHAVLVDMYA